MAQSEFHFFGASVFAYAIAEYGDYADFRSLQFLESNLRAAVLSLHY
jgi:hypothetical protein